MLFEKNDFMSGTRISLEVFPPKGPSLNNSFWDTVRRLAGLNPLFFSVTHGAGGGLRGRTHEIAARIAEVTGAPVAAHMTCMDAGEAEIEAAATQYWEAGIRHIVALRGDAPAGSGAYSPAQRAYPFAVDLVRALKCVADFEISVAAYPDVHPEATSAEADLDNLKRKIDAGATRAITQFFFEPETFLCFRDRAIAAGIKIPIVPGILPITGLSQVRRFAATCGAEVPAWLGELFDDFDADAEMRQLIAGNVLVEQCRVLVDEGVHDFHFYTLNRPSLTHAACHILGLGDLRKQVPASIARRFAL